MSLHIKELPKSERPREKLMMKGVQSLSNAELLALVIGTGSKKENAVLVAQRLLSTYDFESLSRMGLCSLKKVSGIGTAKACQLIAALELGRRNSYDPQNNVKINTLNDVFDLLHPQMSHLNKEHVVGLFLNAKNLLIKSETIFIGSLHATILHPREIFQVAISESASKVIIAHNHPSGDPKPSKEDIEITKQLILSGELLGIELVDHIIIGKKSFCGLREGGYC